MSARDREALAVEHLDMVERIIAGMCRRFPAADREDLRSFAMEGLAQAIDRWDPDRGAAFSTFARNRIVGAIYDGVHQSGRLSRRMLRRVAFYRKADRLLDESSRAPAPLDRVEATHLLAGRLRDAATAYVASMAGDFRMEEAADHSEPADEILARRQYLRLVRRQMEQLPDKQRDAIHLYFIEEQRLPAIADRLGCKKSWVSRLITSGLDSIRGSFVEELDGKARPAATARPAHSR